MNAASQIMEGSGKRLRILRLVLSIGDTSAPYNQFSLAMLKEQDITICTYFKSKITSPKEITLFEGDGSLTGFFRALKAALNRQEHDIVHAHTPHVGFLFLVATFCRSRKSIPTTIYTVHSSFPNYKKLRHKLLLIPVFALFQRVVCCSHASLESVPKLYRWFADDRLCVVRNGVDIDRIDRIVGNKRKYHDNGRFNVTTVGRLIEVKNPLATLYAFQNGADSTCRLVVIGDGCLRRLLLSESKAMGILKQVEMTGLISREEVYRNLFNADLLVSTSRVEGLPIAVLEAMACRCPVLLSDIPSHRELADGADFIPLISGNDIAGFAREIKRFMRMSLGEKADIGQRCRKLVEDRFSLAVMHQLYKKLYAQLLEETQRGNTSLQSGGGWR